MNSAPLLPRRLPLRVTAALAMATAAGCVSVPKVQQAPKGAPAATITVNKGHHSGFGYSGSQTYMLSASGTCTDLKQIATLLWTTGGAKSVRVAPGPGPVVVTATTMYFYTSNTAYQGQGGMAGMGSKSCFGAVRFKAVQGHEYQIVQDAPFYGSGCKMRVTDKATGRPPADLRIGDHATCEDFPAP